MSLYGHLETVPRGGAEGRPRAYVRPSALLSKVLNPIAVAFGRKAVLVVKGRTTGKVLKVPMDPPFEWNGTRYLVSPRGETHWARNLRAAGKADLRTRHGVEHLRVVEIDGAERDAVVKTYASTITCNCRRSMELLPDPADHPVFRIERTGT
ncbi:MAG TPA: hypothetical protein VES19_03065 [Candidatus Limnocylindrales bacterium]|nr:hypothetical protein [Candidatus Limnocylindrales bacterium]